MESQNLFECDVYSYLKTASHSNYTNRITYRFAENYVYK